MKVLMFANAFGVGTQTFITQDIKYLSKKHDLLFLCTRIDDSDNIDNNNLTVKVLGFKHHFFQRKLWQYDLHLSYKSNYFQKELKKVIDVFKPDLIHCQFGIVSLQLIDNIEDKSIPVVIQFRGYDASSMLRKKSYIQRLRQVLNQENYYSIFVAESLRQNLKQHDINVKNSIILHSGIDLSKFKREKYEEHKEFIFLQISSLKEKKGHAYTLKAFAKFLSLQETKKYKLVLAGDGERKTQLEVLSTQLGIHKYVEFVGFVSPLKAKVLLENADVFIHHSITAENGDEEGIPNVLMEAMAMELPIISTYHAGIPELIKDEVNGYLVKEKDIDTYALRMENITKWKKLKINREVIDKEFEINGHIAKLEAFYLKMLTP